MFNFIPLDSVITFDVVTHDPGTMSITDADSTPTFDVFEDSTDTPIIVAQSMTKRTGKTGDYRATFTLSGAAQFDVGKSYNVVVTATVTNTVSLVAITGKVIKFSFLVGPAVTAPGTPKVDVSHILGTASAGAAGAVRSDQVTGSVGSVLGNVNGSVSTVVDMSATAQPELTVPPASNATPMAKLNWLFMLAKNKLLQTASLQTLLGNDDATPVGTSTVADDGTTATRGRFN